jgi:hypothetical protein
MGKVKYAEGIDYVQGSLAKPKVKEGHKCGSYLIGTHRTAATTNPECTRLYIRNAETYKRTTPPSADELAIRERFAQVSHMVSVRKKDLSKINADTAAFLAQKDQPGGKTTMLSWYWMVCSAEYDKQQG